MDDLQLNMNTSVYGLDHSSLSNLSADFWPVGNASTLPDRSIQWTAEVCARVTLFSIIFIATVLGNMLVILTLVQNKRMRTVTNVFLLNLAFSDLLLGVFCMPFTLVGSLLRDFIFGQAMCKIIPYAQAVSVSVSVWTLVSISLERFFAICRPLQSRRWQTVSHAYRVILLIWILSLFAMLPVPFQSELTATKTPGKHKCREEWPGQTSKRAFNLILMVLLFLIPLFIMIFVYSIIVKTLWVGMRMEHLAKQNYNSFETEQSTQDNQKLAQNKEESSTDVLRSRNNPLALRGHYHKSQQAKMRVIRMLFILVIEFFVCWTPLYIVQTWSLYGDGVYRVIGQWGVSTAHLLSYISACCNPITYCFLHSKFRQGFLTIMGCRGPKRKPGSESYFTNTLHSGYVSGVTNTGDSVV